MASIPEGEKLLPFLESEKRFRPLAALFAEKAIEELLHTGGREADSGQGELLPLVTAAFNLVLERCHGVVGALSQTPIEQVFLRSMMLSFLRNSQCLIFMPAFRNTVTELSGWQHQLEKLEEFVRWHKQRHGSDVVTDAYLGEQVRSGRMPADELPQIKELLLLYHYLPFRGAWHVGLQARFLALLRPRGTPRVDMLFWLAAPRSLRLVVECDGFLGHRFKNSFQRDRSKDRALRTRGFDVFRFTGTEINTDPVGAASELFSFLQEKEHRSRVV